MSDIDYPAAHSMDTTWFAVDDDGHVALFDSGEAGAVPQAARQDNQYLFDEVEALAVRGDELAVWQGRSLPWQEPRHELMSGWARPGAIAGLCFLRSLAPVEALLEQGRGFEVPCADEGLRAVIFMEIDRRQAARLHAGGYCRACFQWFEVFDEQAARRGFYVYEHLTENWISGPYGQVFVPERPLHIDELPENWRASLEKVRLQGVRFANRIHIQPIEHCASDSWQLRYLTLDGQEHDTPDE